MEIANLSISEDKEKNSVQYFYTGTSCINPGTPDTRAAICICFNEDENDTMIELLDESLCTNQKAELHAVYRALLCIINELNVYIISKSEYAVKCINIWSNKWRKDNWKSIPDGTNDNKSMVKSIVELIEDLTNEGRNIKIYHWNDILSKKGNNIAYNLARESALSTI